MCDIRRFYELRELYLADFHKLRICEGGRVWANAWEVFRRRPCRGGRGHRAAVDFVVCFWCSGIFFFLFPSKAQGLLQECLASFTSLLVPGCVQGAII